MAVKDDDRLPCGRLVDELWEHIDEPPDAHEVTCPYCRQARSRLDHVTEVAAQLRAHDDQDPAMQISAGVGPAIMQIVHVEVRRARLLPLEAPAGEVASTLVISEQAVADVVRDAADRVPGIRSRRCAVRVLPVLAESTAPEPASIAVELGVAIASDVAVPQAADAVRTMITDQLTERTGLVVETVDLRVEDVFDV